GGGEGVRGRDVGAGREVPAVDVEHDLRPRQVEEVRIAGDVAGMVLEALAAIRLLAADVTLDENAPRAVEQGDPLGEDGFQSCARVLHPLFLLPRENGAYVRARLFRRLVTRSPSCLQSFPGCLGKSSDFPPFEVSAAASLGKR